MQIPLKRCGGEAALALMDEHLGRQDWLAGVQATVADVALFAYTHVSEGGGFCLDNYPAICAWLRRIRTLPGFVPMDD
jgi:glutathione S-transferase